MQPFRGNRCSGKCRHLNICVCLVGRTPRRNANGGVGIKEPDIVSIQIITILTKLLDLVLAVVHLANRYPEVVDFLLHKL